MFRAVTCGVKVICGVRFFEVCVYQSGSALVQKRRMEKAAKLMEKAGIRTALFPRAFQDAERFARHKILPPEEGNLYQAMAAEVVRHLMACRRIAPERCCMALLGSRMSAALQRALLTLAPEVRYTYLTAGRGGGEVCEHLWREYGVSVLQDPPQAQLQRADVVLTFDSAVPCGKPGCLWLPLGLVQEAAGYENALLRILYSAPPRIEEALQADCGRNALLSLLLQAGAVEAKELEVTEIGQNA